MFVYNKYLTGKIYDAIKHNNVQ